MGTLRSLIFFLANFRKKRKILVLHAMVPLNAKLHMKKFRMRKMPDSCILVSLRERERESTLTSIAFIGTCIIEYLYFFYY